MAWEHNTVWRQVLVQEDHGVADPSDLMGRGIPIHEEEAGIVNILTPLGTFALKCKRVLSS